MSPKEVEKSSQTSQINDCKETELKLDCDQQPPDNESNSSSSESSSFSKTTSKNHRVSFPVDARAKNGSLSVLTTKKQKKIVYNRPPDGGWGWVVVFAAFMINLITDGISLSFGLLFVDFLEAFGESKSKTSWIGSLFLSIPLLTGPVASALTDHFGCRKIAITGGVFSAIGFLLGSLSTRIEHLFFAFSIAGFGLALSTVTPVVAVAYYFERKRSLATGLSASGSGIGTFLFAPFTIFLSNNFGWRKSLIFLAGIYLTIVFFGMLIRDIDIDDFDSSSEEDESSSDEDDDSSSENDSGSDMDSHELDSIPEVDEEEFNASKSSSRKLSNECEPFNRKSVFSRSSRARHISECEKEEQKIKRFCTSLINIPTYLRESSKNNDNQVEQNNMKYLKAEVSNKTINEDQSKNHVPEITFRRGGYLHNLIRFYPEFLTPYLQPQNVDYNDDLVAKTVPANAQFQQSQRPTLPHDSKMQTWQDYFNRENVEEGVVVDEIETPVNLNESVSIVVPSTRPSKNDLLHYHKNRTHRMSRLSRNRNRHRMHQTHLQNDLIGGGNCLNNLRLQRGSLTYRNAMLVISKYKLKASSCPDIYKTSMATIHKHEEVSFLSNMKELFFEMFDFSSLKNIPFLIFCLSNFLLYASIDIPYVYLPDQAISTGSYDKESASFLISIFGIFNTPGIILTGYIGDKSYLDANMIYAVFTLVSGIALTAIPMSTNKLIVSSLTAIYGFAISANYSLVSVILVDLISLDSFTQAYGLLLLIQGVGSLLGPPIVGWMYDVSGTYDIAFYSTGIVIALSGVLVLPISDRKNCFFWTKRLSRSGSSTSLVFRPLNFLKQVKSNNDFKMTNSTKKPSQNGNVSKVSSLLNEKNICISNVDT